MPTATEYAEQYRAGASKLRAAVAGMTAEQLKARPVAGKWSTLEVVAHLADFEPIMADRIRRLIALPNPILQGADENAFAAALGYQDRDMAEELAVVDAMRASTARLIAKLTPEQLARTGMHTDYGELSLEKIIQRAINHINHHLPFIEEKKRALGL